MRQRLGKVALLFWETLREIFDEGAYSRFLKREGLPNSRSAYAIFRRENEALNSRRPRCC